MLKEVLKNLNDHEIQVIDKVLNLMKEATREYQTDEARTLAKKYQDLCDWVITLTLHRHLEDWDNQEFIDEFRAEFFQRIHDGKFSQRYEHEI